VVAPPLPGEPVALPAAPLGAGPDGRSVEQPAEAPARPKRENTAHNRGQKVLLFIVVSMPFAGELRASMWAGLAAKVWSSPGLPSSAASLLWESAVCDGAGQGASAPPTRAPDVVSTAAH
jgi:hypothetical protein